KLSAAVIGNETAFKRLESIIHPLVQQEETDFLRKAKEQGFDIVLLDIPLLFETGAENRVDKIAVVSAPFEIQRERVLSRPDMTEEKFASIINRQVPDDEKRKRADFIIDTNGDFDNTRRQIVTIL